MAGSWAGSGAGNYAGIMRAAGREIICESCVELGFQKECF